jgi:Uncharacterised nucleotidyltransferase
MSRSSTKSDPYRNHRLALLPLIAEDPRQAFATVKTALSESDEDQFLNFLLQQGLGPLWYETLTQSSALSFSPSFIDSLKKATLFSTANYLRQQHSLKKIETIFKAKCIPHAVFKGAHIRELIYSNPAVRAACDIDILVSKADKVEAIKALVAAGLIFHPVAENISHEASLADGGASIDLHWDIFRPGRTRIDLTEEFLTTRQESAGLWGLNNEAALFIMLVHPVFTKYGTTPHASLVRIVDLVRWIQTREIDWERLLDWLKRGGVQTAAWITAEWLQMLTGTSLPASFMYSIKPSAVRSFYLQKWLSHNLSSRLLDYPLLIQAGFTLPAHDRFTDACRAISTLLREKQSATEKTKELESICSG